MSRGDGFAGRSLPEPRDEGQQPLPPLGGVPGEGAQAVWRRTKLKQAFVSEEMNIPAARVRIVWYLDEN